MGLIGWRPSHGQTIPYRILSEAGAGFYGCGRELEDPDTLSTVRIGLMGPRKTSEGRHLQYGTALAIEEANLRGGYRGLPYELVFRSDDGPWGIAAKQVVRLTYEDEVWVILGALDGHHAHLAELVAAKAWIPVVTPCAPDLSIDYANVPWVFRCMPDDGQQARSLVQYAHKQGYNDIIVLSEGERESHCGWERLLDVSNHTYHPFVLHIEYDPYHPTAIIPRIRNVEADALILWGRAEGALPLLRAMREGGMTIPILGPSLLASPTFAKETSGFEDIIVAAPYDLSKDNFKLMAFQERYAEYTGLSPSPTALYAYDATRMVLSAIERVGLNRTRIRDELARMSFEGLTGRIRFNDLGGNLSESILMTITSGEWVCVESNPGKP